MFPADSLFANQARFCEQFSLTSWKMKFAVKHFFKVIDFWPSVWMKNVKKDDSHVVSIDTD